MRRIDVCRQLALAAATMTLLTGADWLQFRGPHSGGVSPETRLPVEISVESATWSQSFPGRCVSGPIVVRGQVVTTSSTGRKNDRLHVWSVDAKTGDVLWQRKLWATGRSLCHPLSSMASPTPASDGEHIFVLFASNDLACLDLQGNVRWLRAIGVEHPLAFDDRGLGSSPIVIGDSIVLQVECNGDAFAMGINSATGETRWQLPLKRSINWLSPSVLPWGSEELALIQAADQLMIVDPQAGDVLARYETPGSSIASPVGQDGRVFMPSQGLTVLDYRPGAQEPTLLWQDARLGVSGSSPVVAAGKLFVIRGSNVLTCADVETAEVLWRQRLKGSRYWATPVVAGKHLYAISANGLVEVVDISGREAEVIAGNDMGEELLGSPAVADGAVYLRGITHLWKFEAP